MERMLFLIISPNSYSIALILNEKFYLKNKNKGQNKRMIKNKRSFLEYSFYRHIIIGFRLTEISNIFT